MMLQISYLATDQAKKLAFDPPKIKKKIENYILIRIIKRDYLSSLLLNEHKIKSLKAEF